MELEWWHTRSYPKKVVSKFEFCVWLHLKFIKNFKNSWLPEPGCRDWKSIRLDRQVFLSGQKHTHIHNGLAGWTPKPFVLQAFLKGPELPNHWFYNVFGYSEKLMFILRIRPKGIFKWTMFYQGFRESTFATIQCPLHSRISVHSDSTIANVTWHANTC